VLFDLLKDARRFVLQSSVKNVRSMIACQAFRIEDCCAPNPSLTPQGQIRWQACSSNCPETVAPANRSSANYNVSSASAFKAARAGVSKVQGSLSYLFTARRPVALFWLCSRPASRSSPTNHCAAVHSRQWGFSMPRAEPGSVKSDRGPEMQFMTLHIEGHLDAESGGPWPYRCLS
jgi:hypothetical protein